MFKYLPAKAIAQKRTSEGAIEMEIKTSMLEGFDELPLVAQPANSNENRVTDLVSFVQNETEWLTEKLNQYGGVLFRSFQVREVPEFQSISQALIPELKPMSKDNRHVPRSRKTFILPRSFPPSTASRCITSCHT